MNEILLSLFMYILKNEIICKSNMKESDVTLDDGEHVNFIDIAPDKIDLNSYLLGYADSLSDIYFYLVKLKQNNDITNKEACQELVKGEKK